MLDLIVPPEAKESVSLGRLKITAQIRENAQKALAQAGQGQARNEGRGIELVDVGLSRIEFVPQVREAAFDRAISLMEAIAVKTTSEGEQRKKEIINKTQAEVQKIEGEGKQEASILKGSVDAEIIDAYAKAIREAGDFYTFTRTLESLQGSLQGGHPADPHDRQRAAPNGQDPRAVEAADVHAEPRRRPSRWRNGLTGLRSTRIIARCYSA